MLKINKLNKKFKDFNIRNLSLDITKGDYFVILGKSGAGKSLVLEMIAGLVQPDSGAIFLDDIDLTKKKIQDRKVGLVFQDFAIFPHLTVRNNIAYSLKAKHESKQIISEKVLRFAKESNVEHLLNRYPSKLSGGEKQRVALARTLANNPDCLLLDEPLSSLDIQLKEELRELLRAINKRGITIIHVTHDYEEAIALANNVAVMHNGEIVQSGEIHEVFQNPKNEFVARFTGVKNFFEAEIINRNQAKLNNKVTFQIPVQTKPIEKAKILIESKHIIISPNKIESSATNSFQGKITKVIEIPFGFELIVDIGIPLAVLITKESKEKYNFKARENAWVSFKASEVKIIL